ncbi:hypothetical protein C2S52_005576 [Perilla frutescens var. hirtella]|nr:hypothetical protein C2S52_005576 [Perilla frutescens var. hirtella]
MNDPILHMQWMLYSLRRDLILFENQIPFFVLQELFDLIKDTNQESNDLKSLSLKFFCDIFPGETKRDIAEVKSWQHEIKHLLHLIHCIWLPSVDQLKEMKEKRTASSASSMIRVNIKKKKDGKDERWRFISSVAGLREANVEFEKNDELDLFDIRFENGTMRIAPLRIDYGMETFFRNLIAYEQYTVADEEFSPETAYVKFLDCLVNSSKDVEILSRLEIVDNWLGDDEVVAKMVNRLCDAVVGPGKNFRYAEIFRDVKKHCGKCRNKWMAKLKTNYLYSPWAIISIVVASVLLLLTVTQTLFSILGWVFA